MDRPQRPRSKSTLSFKSNKSNQLRESHEEKRKSHLGERSKANPNAAMNEAQPIAAALEKPTLQSLRSFQHSDVNGIPIAEPDLSNPTRSRWERPLDTIRSFEAAIDNEYKRRSHGTRGDASTEIMSGYASRRSSYYGGHGDQNRYSQAGGGGGHYGSRQAAAARESWADNGYGPTGPSRSRYNRMSSDPGWARSNHGHGVYPTQGYQQSRDTVNTGGSNGSNSDAAPYSTDPSSENSSIERAMPPMQPKPDPGEQYGFSGFGGGPQPILEEYGPGPGQSNGYYPQYQQNPNLPPPVPAKTQHLPNSSNVIKSSGQQGPPPANGGRPNVLQRNSTDASGKRKSWLKRRFSKNA